MAEMKFIPSQRGGKLLAIDGFMYRIQNKTKKKSFWRCASRLNCKARLILTNGEFERNVMSHNHEQDSRKIRTKMLLLRIKERIKEEIDVPVSKIYREEVAAASTSVDDASYFPPLKKIEKTLYRARCSAKPKGGAIVSSKTSPKKETDGETSDGTLGIKLQNKELEKVNKALSRTPVTIINLSNDIQNPSLMSTPTIQSTPRTSFSTQSPERKLQRLASSSEICTKTTPELFENKQCVDKDKNSINCKDEIKHGNSFEAQRTISNIPKEHDELETFGKSIVNQMRHLPEICRIQLMGDIQNLVTHKRLDYIMKSKNSSDATGTFHDTSSSSLLSSTTANSHNASITMLEHYVKIEPESHSETEEYNETVIVPDL